MTISIVRAATTDHAAVIPLIEAQQERQYQQDPRLYRRSSADLAAILLGQSSNDGVTLIAHNAQGQVRGYAQAATWTTKETSLLLAFLTARNGIVRTLTLPHPDDADTQEVVRALLVAIDTYWRDTATTGDLLRWASTDSVWVEPLFLEYQFRLDSVCAVRLLQHPFFSAGPTSLPTHIVRTARPDDEEALVGLFAEELHFHERLTPFVRSSPQVLSAFRGKLQRIWEGRALDQGAPIVLVVEQNNTIVAMAENSLLEVGPQDDPGFTPPGRYWCIDNMSVTQTFQGRGIGRLLVQAIEDRCLSLHLNLDGYVLWFNPDNPNAARFWTTLDFQPLWTTYQRRQIHAQSD